MDVFGVTDLIAQTQLNYVWGEQDAPSVRNANLPASLIYHRLTAARTHECGFLYAVADNAASQNRSWCMLQLLCAYAAIHKCSIYYHVLLQGHTKAQHTACFGLIKRALKKRAVYTPQEYMQLVDDSSHVNKAVNVAKDIAIKDLASSLARFFKKVRSISLNSNRHFYFDKDHPGTMRFRQTARDNWQEVVLFKDGTSAASLSPTIFTADAMPLPRAVLSQKRHSQLKGLKDKFFTGVEDKREAFYKEPTPSELAQCPISLASDPDLPDFASANVATVQ